MASSKIFKLNPNTTAKNLVLSHVMLVCSCGVLCSIGVREGVQIIYLYKEKIMSLVLTLREAAKKKFFF